MCKKMTNFPEKIFFLGAGGIGMSALIRYFLAQNHEVMGYDKTQTKLTQKINSEGASIFYEDNVSLVPASFLNPKEVLVVITPAIPKDSELLNFFIENNFTILKRAQVLGKITQSAKSIAVSGTHGKTTISSLIASCLHHNDKAFTAFLGGISNNLQSNYYHDLGSEITVVEADEYDKSFLQLFPNCIVVSALDPDHLDIYGTEENMIATFQQFTQKNLKENGAVIAHKSIAHKLETTCFTYALEDNTADYFVNNIQIVNHNFVADFNGPKVKVANVAIGLPGIHNLENSLAAFAALHFMGMDVNEIAAGIKNYKGVERRFDIKLQKNDCIFIDDYAHHPAEITQLVKSVKILYPEQKICGVFQPHLFSRTRDFLDGFAEALELLDELILLDIYPARELPIPGVTSEVLLNKVNKKLKMLCSKKDVLHHLNETKCNVVLSIGAGDIGAEVEKYMEVLKNKWGV